MDKKINIDHQRMEATVSLEGTESKVMIISEGQARFVELPEYGETIIKTQGDKVQLFEVKERHKF